MIIEQNLSSMVLSLTEIPIKGRGFPEEAKLADQQTPIWWHSEVDCGGCF